MTSHLSDNIIKLMKCICVGGGDFAEKKFKWDEDDLIMAVDSGYGYIKDLCKVDYVVGDLDSLGYVPEEKKIVKLDCHKDNTDMLEACKIAWEEGCRQFVLYGALGKRLDHTIANLQNAKHLVERGCSVVMEDMKQTLYVTDGILRFKDMVGKTVSVFSFDQTNISLEGFEYPLSNHTLTNSYPLGVSNVVVEDVAKVRVNSGIAMVIVNDDIK